ncbi:MAG: hypothetical protein H6883_09310 [Rhodobiaceae bacterium]|nr:hypothetical protein [Rhodobiaceae bacterium]MCC0056324.1 hypothetical protein [Rhodobiaceae bacterium]
MKSLLAALLILALSAPAALADDCVGRVADILKGSAGREKTMAVITTEMKGQKPTVNEFHYAKWDHYMVRMIEPAGQPLTLTHDGAMYQSADEGKSWTKVHSFDKEETRALGQKTVEEQAGSIRNAICGNEELDGKTYDTLEADMTNVSGMKFQIHSKYWVAADGFVVKATTLMKADNFESFTTQEWQPAPDMELPLPN